MADPNRIPAILKTNPPRGTVQAKRLIASQDDEGNEGNAERVLGSKQ